MIVKKSWEKVVRRSDGAKKLTHFYTGWFALWIVPIYIERKTFKHG